MRSAILSGAMALPLELVSLPALQKTLTASYKPMGATVAIKVEAYRVDTKYIYVPRQFGLGFCARHGIPVEDQTSQGVPITFPKVPTPRDYQHLVLDTVVDNFDKYYDFIFKAHTGWGKTLGSLIVAARLGVSTLVIVDQDNLKSQWLCALDDHFGLTIENGGVGIIQGKVCEFSAPVVIAMVQTLSQKVFPKAVYDRFGFIIVDEVHITGAPTFSKVLRQFSATYRLGVSATPVRNDGLQRLLNYNLGEVRVAAEKEHNESAVYIRDHATIYSWYGNISPKTGRIFSEIVADGSRNLLIAETAKALYETGRDVLVLGDRIEQLKHLKSLMYYLGVADSEMGLYAGYDPIYQFAKNATPQRRPYGVVSGTEFTPISLQSIAKKIPKKKLEATRKEAKILFATYGMCAKGFDEPRLKAGIDATPRSEVEQIHGRILREIPGMRMPIWATIRDFNSPRLMYSFKKRITGYLKSNGRFYEWTKNGELLQCHETEILSAATQRLRELKSLQIVTNSEGHSTLVTPQSVKTQKRQHAIDTVQTIHSRKRG